MLQTLQYVPEYKEELIYPAICRTLDALGIADDMRPDLKVVIKPNLIMACHHPSPGDSGSGPLAQRTGRPGHHPCGELRRSLQYRIYEKYLQRLRHEAA